MHIRAGRGNNLRLVDLPTLLPSPDSQENEEAGGYCPEKEWLLQLRPRPSVFALPVHIGSPNTIAKSHSLPERTRCEKGAHVTRNASVESPWTAVAFRGHASCAQHRLEARSEGVLQQVQRVS